MILHILVVYPKASRDAFHGWMQIIESWQFSCSWMSGSLSVNLALSEVGVPCGSVVEAVAQEWFGDSSGADGSLPCWVFKKPKRQDWPWVTQGLTTWLISDRGNLTNTWLMHRDSPNENNTFSFPNSSLATFSCAATTAVLWMKQMDFTAVFVHSPHPSFGLQN